MKTSFIAASNLRQNGLVRITLPPTIRLTDALLTRVQASLVRGPVVPPRATTDLVCSDRRPIPEERAALLASLRKL